MSDRLPAYLTPLTGRQDELALLLRLLPSVRLLTLTGPGGVGKTRLALALAERVRAELEVPAWWVDLTGIEDPGLVGAQVLRAAGAAELSPKPVADTIASTLSYPSLLVIDNCEQVADACAGLLDSILPACPELTVIATSRQPLGVAGEQRYRVSGLPLTDDVDGAPRLFIDRARRHDPTLSVDDRAMAAIHEICERLEGMPLAIELAASRTPLLAVAELSVRLRSDPRVLRDQTGQRPERHQSLEATLEWSHQLLTPRAQTVFRRLAAFRGSFNLGAAEAVAAGDGVDEADVIDVLGELVDQSLVEVELDEPENRYRLLLAVQSFAGTRLDASGEDGIVRARHARWFAELAAEAEPGVVGPEPVPWLERLEAEQDNLRGALEWALAADLEIAAKLVCRLWPFWYRRGYYHEARRWLEEMVRVVDRTTPATRARVLLTAATFAHLQCDYALAVDRLELALSLCRQLGDTAGAATALQRLGSVAREQANYERAIDLHRQSLALWQELDDPFGIADSLHFLSFASWLGADLEHAQEYLAEALARFEELGEQQEVAGCRLDLGVIAHYRGDDERAASLLDEAIDLAREFRFEETIAWALHERGVVAAHSYQLPEAAERFVEALELHRRLDQWRTARVIEDIAGTLLVPLEPGLAAELFAAAESARERIKAPVPLAERPAHEGYLRELRRALSAADLDARRAAGREMRLDDAAREASSAARRLYLGPATPARLIALLTPREHSVLKLVSEGRTNREIGATLAISTSTVGVHVSNVLRKLNVTRRAQAVARGHDLGIF